ncbi:Flp family type IVb pilin [Sphingomonas sp. RS6]
MTIFRALQSDVRAATAVEYGLILAMIVLAIMASLMGLADATSSMWSNVSEKVQGAGTN